MAKQKSDTKKVTNKKKTTKKTPTKKIPAKKTSTKKKELVRNTNKKVLNVVFGIIIVLLFALGLFLINNSKCDTNPVNNPIQYQEKNNLIPSDVLKLEDISIYQNKYNNKDIIGLLYIPGTDIKEPITQSKDNNHYLNHDLYNKRDIRGTVFLDYRVNPEKDRKILIYSHNSETIEVPFQELEGYYKKGYYEKHKYIYLKTLYGISKYEVFSVFVETENWDYMETEYDTDEEWYNHIKELKDKSWYETDITINKEDNIMILQTCSELKEYKNYDSKYLLVISKKIA